MIDRESERERERERERESLLKPVRLITDEHILLCTESDAFHTTGAVTLNF